MAGAAAAAAQLRKEREKAKQSQNSQSQPQPNPPDFYTPARLPELKTEEGYSADIVRTLCRHCADIVPKLCGHISPGIYVRTMSALYPSSVFSSGRPDMSIAVLYCTVIYLCERPGRPNMSIAVLMSSMSREADGSTTVVANQKMREQTKKGIFLVQGLMLHLPLSPQPPSKL